MCIRDINELFLQLFKTASETINQNPVLDSECIFNLLRIMYPATYGDTLIKLRENGLDQMLPNIPHSSSLVYKNFGLCLIPKYERNGVRPEYKKSVEDLLKNCEMGQSCMNFNIMTIPNDQKDVDCINAWFKLHNDNADIS